MSDEQMDAQGGGERGLIRIGRSERGRSWSVSVRVGDTPAELERAYEIAVDLERRLMENDPPPRPPRR
jgi:hypothetical protein